MKRRYSSSSPSSYYFASLAQNQLNFLILTNTTGIGMYNTTTEQRDFLK